MTSRFVVLENRERTTGHNRFVFVRDGGGFWGLVFPLFWLLWHRVWFAAAIVFGLTAAMSLLTETSGWQIAGWLGLFAIAIAVWLEGGQWRVNALQRSGFVPVAVVNAVGQAEAEMRFIHGTAGADAASASIGPPPLPGLPRRPTMAKSGDMIFAENGRGV